MLRLPSNINICIHYGDDSDDYGCGGSGERIINTVCEGCWDGFGLLSLGHPDQPKGWESLTLDTQKRLRAKRDESVKAMKSTDDFFSRVEDQMLEEDVKVFEAELSRKRKSMAMQMEEGCQKLARGEKVRSRPCAGQCGKQIPYVPRMTRCQDCCRVKKLSSPQQASPSGLDMDAPSTARIFLKCPFAQKDAAKALGAR